jgi:hypothetical protein
MAAGVGFHAAIHPFIYFFYPVLPNMKNIQAGTPHWLELFLFHMITNSQVYFFGSHIYAISFLNHHSM